MIISTKIGDFQVRQANNFGGLDLYNKEHNIRAYATYHKSIDDFSVGEIKTQAVVNHKETRDMLVDALHEYTEKNEDWEVQLKLKNISEAMDKIEVDLDRIRKIVDEEGWEGLYKRGS